MSASSLEDTAPGWTQAEYWAHRRAGRLGSRHSPARVRDPADARHGDGRRSKSSRETRFHRRARVAHRLRRRFAGHHRPGLPRVLLRPPPGASRSPSGPRGSAQSGEPVTRRSRPETPGAGKTFGPGWTIMERRFDCTSCPTLATAGSREVRGGDRVHQWEGGLGGDRGEVYLGTQGGDPGVDAAAGPAGCRCCAVVQRLSAAV
mmetsp:Transcript_31395/g.81563  ORF Transcript_31395/g.81563 Transcript_31395/m.81563 type:complete len:204 (+) Transcript_31395:134-745(+)